MTTYGGTLVTVPMTIECMFHCKVLAKYKRYFSKLVTQMDHIDIHYNVERFVPLW